MADSQGNRVSGMPDDALKALVEAGRAPLADWPNRYPGRRAMGYLCSYVPEEIIHAGGFSPVRIRGNRESLRQADAHLQSFTCALCRSSLDQVLGGSLQYLHGVVFAHTCDTMQALADLWRMNSDASYFVDTVMQPANVGSPAGRPYLVSELSRFRERLASFAGFSIADDELTTSIALYDETRRLVRALHRLRDRLGVSDFYAVLDAGQVMPRVVYNSLLSKLLVELDLAPPDSDGPRLFLVGAVLDEPRLLDLIQEQGGEVVGDDLCSGMRHFHDQVGDGPPIPALAEYYLRRPPCPTKFHPRYSPVDSLLDQIRQIGAQGVLFILEKFCEPHAFDYALVRPGLDQAGVPHLLLEMEQTPSLEALRTRLQAFIEIL
jgi:bzd-type benzoyl-CoA reductase N subunit